MYSALESSSGNHGDGRGHQDNDDTIGLGIRSSTIRSLEHCFFSGWPAVPPRSLGCGFGRYALVAVSIATDDAVVLNDFLHHAVVQVTENGHVLQIPDH